jgi:hypothetical protein
LGRAITLGTGATDVTALGIGAGAGAAEDTDNGVRVGVVVSAGPGLRLVAALAAVRATVWVNITVEAYPAVATLIAPVSVVSVIATRRWRVRILISPS